MSWSLRLAAFFVLALVCLTLVHLRLLSYAEDDAYIHLRIAGNLIHHGRPYFNLNESVSGSSSPVWTLLLAVILGATRDSLSAVAVLNAAVSAAGAIVHGKLLNRLIPSLSRSIVWGFGLCYLAVTLRASVGLMETGLALLVWGLAIHLLLDRNRLGLVLLGGLVFIRYEFALFLALITVFATGREGVRARDRVIFPLAGMLPFVLYDLGFFGTVVPHAVIAKSIVYDVPISADFGLAMVLLSIPVGIFLVVRLRKISELRIQILHLMLIFGLAVIPAYTLLGTLVFSWYEPIYMVPFLYGICLMMLYFRLGSSLARFASVAMASTVACWWCVRLILIVLSATVLPPTFFSGFEDGARARRYVQVGRELYRQYPGATLLASEIGGLGYGFPGRIADGAGLVSPGALKYHPMKVPDERRNGLFGAIPVRYVGEVNPELIVSHEIFIEAFRRSTLAEQYLAMVWDPYVEQDMRWAGNQTGWNNSRLMIFIRKDVLGSPR